MDVISMDVVATIIALCSLLLSVWALWRSQKTGGLVALEEYYREDNSAEMIKIRQALYEMSPEEIADLSSDDTERARICSLYQFYAELYDKKIINRKSFEAVFGLGARRLYLTLEPYISARRAREGDNPQYAMQFEKLAKKIID